MAERDLLVRILGDEKDYQRALRSSAKGTTAFDAKITRSSAGLAKWGKAAGVAAAAAGVGIAVLATKGVKAASDLNEEVSKSRVLFGDSADDVLKWSKTTANSIGLSQRAALQASGNFAAMFATIGVGEGVSANMSKTLVTLGADLASFSNENPEEMLDRLRAGLSGEAEPLRRFGILLSEARVKQEAVRLGLVKTGDELTEQQKVQARYSLILKDSRKAQGDFARTSDSLANSQRRIRASMEDVSASLGGVFLPIVAKAADGFADFLGKIGQAQGLRAKVQVAWEGIRELVQNLATEIGAALGQVNWGSVFAVVGQQARAALILVGQTLAAIPWGRVGREIGARLSQALAGIASFIEGVDWAVVGSTIVTGVIDFLKGVDWVGLFKSVVRLWVAALKAQLNLMKGIGKTLGRALGRALGDALAAVKKWIVRKALEIVDGLLGAFGFLGRLDPFKGVRENVQARLKEMEADTKTSVDNINRTLSGIQTPDTTGSSGNPTHRGAAGGSGAAEDVDAQTDENEDLGGALDENAKTTKRTKTKAEKAREAFDELMAVLGLRLDKAAITAKFSDDLAVLRAMEAAVLEQIKIEGRTAEHERTLFEIRQQRIALRQQQTQAKQYVALGLLPTGEKRGPSVKNLRQRASSLLQQIKGTPLDTPKVRAQLARITKVLKGAYGKVGRDVRAAILAMLNDISSALKGGTSTTGGGGSGELTRGGIRSTEKLIAGLGLTPEQEAAIRRRNMRVTRRGNRVSAFGFAIGRGSSGAPRDGHRDGRIDTRRVGGRGGDGAIVINGPVTVRAEDPESFMRALQKRSKRTSGSRRGRHGGVRLGLG